MAFGVRISFAINSNPLSAHFHCEINQLLVESTRNLKSQPPSKQTFPPRIGGRGHPKSELLPAINEQGPCVCVVFLLGGVLSMG